MHPLLLAFRMMMLPARRRFARDLADPAAAQNRRLQHILRTNASSAFGREHGFSDLQNFDDYRRRVPIRTYDDFAPYVDRMCRGEANVLASQPVNFFATTSGTSADPKHCPVTRDFTREHHRSHLLWMHGYASDNPGVLGGQLLTLVSPAETGRTPGGTPIGSHSGRQYLNQAIPIRMKHPVPYAAFLVEDYAARYHTILTFALRADLSGVTSVNPSTLVLLGRLLNERAQSLLEDLERGTLQHAGAMESTLRQTLESALRPAPERARELRERLRADGSLIPRNVWPDIAAMATWQGGSAPFYLSQLDELWGAHPRRCLGLRASEGTLSIPLADNTPVGVFAIGGHVLEFVEETTLPTPETPTLLAHELEVGRRYRTILTTSGGFYRYDLADIVEVTGKRDATPEVQFLHKAGNVLSVTGEKVTEDQVVTVMRNITAGGPPLAGFTVTQELVQPPRLVLVVEPESPDTDDEAWCSLLARFDDALRAANEEYDSKRASGRLAMPRALLLTPGSYRRWREALVAEGRPDGQIKPPHLVRPEGPGPCPRAVDPFFRRVEIARAIPSAPPA